MCLFEYFWELLFIVILHRRRVKSPKPERTLIRNDVSKPSENWDLHVLGDLENIVPIQERSGLGDFTLCLFALIPRLWLLILRLWCILSEK
jgi:hypothetical protein